MLPAEAVEDRFFRALLDGDTTALGDLVTDDFVLVDIISGGVAHRADFLEAFRRGRLTFSRVDLVERFTRLHGDVAVIVGRTELAGDHGGSCFAVSSRYTHVLVGSGGGQWRLKSGQGTPVLDG